VGDLRVLVYAASEQIAPAKDLVAFLRGFGGKSFYLPKANKWKKKGRHDMKYLFLAGELYLCWRHIACGLA
jgi:Mor family transcriptional regulator